MIQKNWFILGLLVFSVFLAGCSTVTDTGTTPTFDPWTISGTVTLSGDYGFLYVGATTDNTLTTTEGWKDVTTLISTGETSYNYTVTGVTNETYYVVGTLYLGETSLPGGGNLRTGDKLGQYSNGYVPPAYGKTPSAEPDAITIIGGAGVGGKDFSLNITW